ncbi:MAG: hypothetical protein M1820_001917 [Bogoriella megaspora]|nr:MAG: hypothetical protein M1820_001917 [Bogoriella megaspora]
MSDFVPGSQEYMDQSFNDEMPLAGQDGDGSHATVEPPILPFDIFDNPDVLPGTWADPATWLPPIDNHDNLVNLGSEGLGPRFEIGGCDVLEDNYYQPPLQQDSAEESLYSLSMISPDVSGNAQWQYRIPSQGPAQFGSSLSQEYMTSPAELPFGAQSHPHHFSNGLAIPQSGFASASLPCGTADASLDEDESFRFVSGCKPLRSSASTYSYRIEKEPEIADESAIKCVFKGCRYKGTFNRKYDLQRHEKSHNRDLRHPCPAAGCDRVGTKAFSRFDKLCDHTGSKHDSDTRFKCPIEGCSVGPLPLALFRLHAFNHRGNTPWNMLSRTASLARAANRILSKCPVKQCKYQGLGFDPKHITYHSEEERCDHSAEFAARGFDSATGFFRCPMCLLLAPDREAFVEHLEVGHMTSDPEHYLAWRSECMKQAGRSGEVGRLWTKWKGNKGESIVCPRCNQQQNACLGRWPYLHDHHLTLIVYGREVEEHAEEILRIVPEFGTMPLFDEILPREEQRVVWHRYLGPSWSDYVDLGMLMNPALKM